MQTSTNVPAIIDVSTTATTQLGPITALATLDGCYQATTKPAQVWTLYFHFMTSYTLICSDHRS